MVGVEVEVNVVDLSQHHHQDVNQRPGETLDVERIVGGEENHEYHHEPDGQPNVGGKEFYHLLGYRSECREYNTDNTDSYIYLNMWIYFPNLGIFPTSINISSQRRRQVKPATWYCHLCSLSFGVLGDPL